VIPVNVGVLLRVRHALFHATRVAAKVDDAELGQPSGQTIVCDALERVQNGTADLIRVLLEMPTVAELQML
jgi:hypothetical protein